MSTQSAATDRPSPDALADVIRMRWFTMEMGPAREDGAIKAYGAAILSSPQVMQRAAE